MKKNRYCLFLYFLFLLIIAKENVYAQREIQSVEDSFTFDYAVKYLMSLPAIEAFPDYWFLDNFKAPDGIKSIEVYPYDDKTNFFTRIPTTMFINGKEIATEDYVFVYSYSSEHGFLEKTVLYPYDKKNKKYNELRGVLYQTYQYQIDEKEIWIDITYPNTENVPMCYRFDIETGNLLTIVKSANDSLCFQYKNGQNKFQKGMLVEIIDGTEKYSVNTSEMKEMMDSFSILSGKNIYYNKDQSEIETFIFNRAIEQCTGTWVNFYFNDRELTVFLTKYDEPFKKGEKKIFINLLFDSKRKFIRATIEQKKIPVSYSYFDSMMKKKYLFGLIQKKHEKERENFSLVRKNDKKWVRYANVRIDSNKHMIAYNSKKIDKIKIKYINIYNGNSPLIIYK